MIAAPTTSSSFYDIIILGAGPAGCACALALQHSGLKVAVIDKHQFPRDKVCGDAIPGRAIKFLQEIDPLFSKELLSFPEKLPTRKTACFYHNRSLEFNWRLEAYTSTRMNFDHFLFSTVKQHTGAAIYEKVNITDITRDGSGYTVTCKQTQQSFSCTLLIGADGINGISAKKLAGYQVDRKHHVAAVRAYYSNIDNLDETCTEVYFDKKYLPGYFWIFPVKGGLANVGFGLLSADVVKKNINVKKAFYEFIERSPILREKLKKATPESELQGCGIPLGSRWATMSGDHFLLAGDAACLVDPISGDGIGNAVLSGKLAAEQAIRSFQQQNFSKLFLQQYEQQLYKVIGADMKKKAAVLKYLSHMPVFFDIAFLIGKNRIVKKFMK